MLRYLLVCLALLGIAPDVNAQSAPPAAHQPANAMQLSRLLNPDDKILAASDSAFRTGFEAALTKDPETAAMFKEHPALLDAIYDGALPVVRRQVKDSMPTLHQKCTRFFAERFTPAEIDQLIAFYGSPTGSKLVTGMYAGLDMSKIVEAIGPEGKDPVTGDAMKGAIASTIVGVLPSFNEAD